MIWLAFDFGQKFIGVAVTELRLATASALTTIGAKHGVPVWAELDKLITEWQPAGLVVGLPLNMDDSESEMSGRAREFAKRLAKRYGTAVEFADERLSSFEAKDRGGDQRNHALAAQIIAETWLASRPEDREG